MDFLNRYPFSLTAADAEAEIARIGELKKAYDEDLKSKIIRSEAERQKIRADYHDRWKEYLKRENEPKDLQGLREITSRYDVPLIFDEVVTGFRLAYGGAQEYYGVTPDLAAIGKIVGGGFPLAAVVGRKEHQGAVPVAGVRDLLANPTQRVVDPARSGEIISLAAGPEGLESGWSGELVNVHEVEIEKEGAFAVV